MLGIIKASKINIDLPRILCMTVDLKTFHSMFKNYDLWEEAIARLLYQIDLNSIAVANGMILSVNNKRPIIKKSGAKITTGLFLNSLYSNISGILFVKPYVLRPLGDMENIGYDILYSDDFNLIAEDFCLYINPHAENKIKPMLAKSFFDFGVSICQFKGNKIKQLTCGNNRRRF